MISCIWVHSCLLAYTLSTRMCLYMLIPVMCSNSYPCMCLCPNDIQQNVRVCVEYVLGCLLWFYLTVHRIIYTRALKPQHIKILKGLDTILVWSQGPKIVMLAFTATKATVWRWHQCLPHPQAWSFMSIFMSVHLATLGPRLRNYIGAIHRMPKEWINSNRASYT